MSKKLIIDRDFLLNEVEWQGRSIMKDNSIFGIYGKEDIDITRGHEWRTHYNLTIASQRLGDLYNLPQKDLKDCWNMAIKKFKKEEKLRNEKRRAKYDMQLK